MTQLIIIRGNSGSGKSTIAAQVRTQLLSIEPNRKIALIGQDHFRRIVLKEEDLLENTDIIDLIDQTVRFALSRKYLVLLEGIFSAQKYGDMLRALAIEFDTKIFYMDVSFKETLKRHQTKPNKHEFGADEMRDWFLNNDTLNLPDEIIIPEASSLADSVNQVVELSNDVISTNDI